jgi:hypothetical protein
MEDCRRIAFSVGKNAACQHQNVLIGRLIRRSESSRIIFFRRRKTDFPKGANLMIVKGNGRKFIIFGKRFFPFTKRSRRCPLRVLDGWDLRPQRITARMILQQGLKPCSEECGKKCEFIVG